MEEGTQFVVVGDADVIILKAISQPDPGEFEALIQQAKTAGLNAKIFSLPLQKQGDMVSFI